MIWVPVSQQLIDDAKGFTDAMCRLEGHPPHIRSEESSICRCGRVTWPKNYTRNWIAQIFNVPPDFLGE